MADTIQLEGLAPEVQEELNEIKRWQHVATIDKLYEHMRVNNDLFAASGFVDFGGHYDGLGGAVNQGLWSYQDGGDPNTISMGRGADDAPEGVSGTYHPTTAIAGVVAKTLHVSDPNGEHGGRNYILFPQAPDGTVTYDSATGEIVKHASAAEAFEGLVENGDFRNGGSNWGLVAGGSDTLTAVNGELAMQSDGFNTSYAEQTSVMQVGTEYTLEIVVSHITSGAISLRYLAAGESLIDTAGRHEITFTADSTRVQLFRQYGQVNDWAVSSVSVTPVTQEVVTERVDFAFQESFLRKVYDAETDTYLGQVYPNGCIQSKAADFEGVATSDDTDRPDTFFAQYHYTATDGTVIDTDTESRGLGVWPQDQSDEWLEQVSGTTHHVYRMPNGDLVQWCTRIRTVAGAGNGDWDSVRATSTAQFLNYRAVNSQGSTITPQGILDTPQELVGVSGGRFNTKTFSDSSIVAEFPFDVPTGVFTAANRGSPYNTNATVAVDGLCFALPLLTVARLNQGAYHPSLNEMGTKHFGNGAGSPHWEYLWSNTSWDVHTKADCFGEMISTTPTGAIGLNSGRDDGKYYDAIYPSGQGGVSDLRLSAYEWCPVVDLAKADAKAKNGTLRGVEKLAFTKVSSGGDVESPSSSIYLDDSFLPLEGSEVVSLYGADGTEYQIHPDYPEVMVINGYATLRSSGYIPVAAGLAYVVTIKTNVSVEGNATNGFTCKEVIGDPANILQTDALKGGWYGYWCPEIGTNIYPKLSRKALPSSSTQAYYTISTGAWTSRGVPVDSVLNSLSSDHYTDQFIYITIYQAAPYVSEPSTNSPILGGESGLGGVFATERHEAINGALLAESLIGKVTTASSGKTRGNFAVTTSYMNSTGVIESTAAFAPMHSPIDLAAPTNNSPAVKALTYAVSNNQQASLNYAWNELAHGGSDWGDDGVLVIEDSGTYTNLNGTELKCGTNTLTKPLGWTKNRARVGEQNEGVDL